METNYFIKLKHCVLDVLLNNMIFAKAAGCICPRVPAV